MTKKILYIHGFASTGGSPKVEQLRWITSADVISPTLTHNPIADMAMLEALVESENITTVVGSSLGGFYALYLAQRHDLGVVLLNPSLNPYDSLMDMRGMIRVFGTDTFFEWGIKQTDELIHLSNVVDAALDPKTSAITWKRVLLLLAVNDERLPYTKAARAMPYAKVVLDLEQNHRFADLMPYTDMIRTIVNSKPCVGEPLLF